MKKLILLSLLLISTSAFAGGDVYFGKYFQPKISGNPNGSNPQFVAGVKLDQTFLDRLDPYVQLETLMDAENKDGSFHPISIRYTVGVNLRIVDGFYIGGERMCWHPVDHGGPVDQYWLAKGGYKW